MVDLFPKPQTMMRRLCDREKLVYLQSHRLESDPEGWLLYPDGDWYMYATDSDKAGVLVLLVEFFEGEIKDAQPLLQFEPEGAPDKLPDPVLSEATRLKRLKDAGELDEFKEGD